MMKMVETYRITNSGKILNVLDAVADNGSLEKVGCQLGGPLISNVAWEVPELDSDELSVVSKDGEGAIVRSMGRGSSWDLVVGNWRVLRRDVRLLFLRVDVSMSSAVDINGKCLRTSTNSPEMRRLYTYVNTITHPQRHTGVLTSPKLSCPR